MAISCATADTAHKSFTMDWAANRYLVFLQYMQRRVKYQLLTGPWGRYLRLQIIIFSSRQKLNGHNVLADKSLMEAMKRLRGLGVLPCSTSRSSETWGCCWCCGTGRSSSSQRDWSPSQLRWHWIASLLSRQTWSPPPSARRGSPWPPPAPGYITNTSLIPEGPQPVESFSEEAKY